MSHYDYISVYLTSMQLMTIQMTFLGLAIILSDVRSIFVELLGYCVYMFLVLLVLIYCQTAL